MKKSDPSYAELLGYLVGEQLSAVTFVQDYLQLHFDGPTLNVTGPLTVTAGSERRSAWENGFRDLLCGRIAKLVSSVTSDEASITFAFTDGSEIAVSLVPFAGCPEAVYLHDHDGRGVWFAV